MEKKTKALILFGICCAVFAFVPTAAHAASLYLSPSSGTYNVGSSFTVSVYVSSTEQAINAASSTILFPADHLRITSISKAGSIISLWVQEPSYANDTGTTRFEGIILNPGFQGSGGKLVSITFKVLSAGSAAVTFRSGTALANDGEGTNILSGLRGATFATGITQPGSTPGATPAVSSGTLAAPTIHSSTHPDSTKWYALNEAKFSWDLPSGVTAVRLGIGKNANGTPQVLYTTPISSKTVPDLTDGIWYFHVQFRDASGWGATTHFQLNVDTTKPDSFEITPVSRPDLTDPHPAFTFSATDSTSGIDHYEIELASGSETWRDDGTHTYKTAALLPGEYAFQVRAVDKAGNAITSAAQATVRGLQAPTITDYSAGASSGERVMVRGTSAYPNAHALVSFQRDEHEAPLTKEVTTDQQGSFAFTGDRAIGEGTYTVWAEIVDARGAHSDRSTSVTISVGQSFILKLIARATPVLALLVPFIALLLALAYVIWIAWKKFAHLRMAKPRGQSATHAQRELQKALKTLTLSIRGQIKLLHATQGQRELTQEEGKILKRLKNNFTSAEKLVKREMKQIERP